MDRIEEPKIERDSTGKITTVRFAFGPHYFVEVWVEDGKANAAIGATHHGFKADASEVGGELEKFVNEVMKAHTENSL